MTHHKHEDEWEETEVEVGRPVAMVVSTRLPRPLAERLAAAAARRGLSVAAYVREVIEDHLDGVATGAGELSAYSRQPLTVFFTGGTAIGRSSGDADAQAVEDEGPKILTTA